jgi:hypothetical protein
MIRYVCLDEDGRITGSGTSTDPSSFEPIRQHHKGNVDIVPHDMKIEHGAKYDRKEKRIVAPPLLIEPPKLMLTPEQERHAAMPPIEEFAEAFYQERRGNPAMMEAYLRKRDKVERKFSKAP